MISSVYPSLGRKKKKSLLSKHMLGPVLSKEKPYKFPEPPSVCWEAARSVFTWQHHLSACPKLLVSQSQGGRLASDHCGSGEDPTVKCIQMCTKNTYKNIHSTLFLIESNERVPKCPLTMEWVNKVYA